MIRKKDLIEHFKLQCESFKIIALLMLLIALITLIPAININFLNIAIPLLFGNAVSFPITFYLKYIKIVTNTLDGEILKTYPLARASLEQLEKCMEFYEIHGEMDVGVVSNNVWVKGTQVDIEQRYYQLIAKKSIDDLMNL